MDVLYACTLKHKTHPHSVPQLSMTKEWIAQVTDADGNKTFYELVDAVNSDAAAFEFIQT